METRTYICSISLILIIVIARAYAYELIPRVMQYYELRPYIYKDPHTGALAGMIIDAEKNMGAYKIWSEECKTTEPFYIFQESTYDEVHRIWDTIPDEKARNQSSLNRYLAPVLKTNFRSEIVNPLYQIDSISVVGLRRSLDVSNKFFLALWQMIPLAYLELLLVLAMAAVMLILVHNSLVLFCKNAIKCKKMQNNINFLLLRL